MLTYLIDDDAVSLFIADQMLRLEGFRGTILPFENSEKALAYLLANLAVELPQFIFLDLNMPVLDGWAFLDALTPHIGLLQGRCHIYLMTSSLALADSAKAQLYALVRGIIHKPLSEKQVEAIIAQETIFP